MRYSLTLLPAIMLAACTTDDFIGMSNRGQHTELQDPAPIVIDGLGSNAQAATRAGGQTAANLLGGSFRLFATNTNGVVFNNYQVRWEGTEDLSTTNRVGWEYQGYMSKAQPSALQQIKFWDLSAPRYDFVAFAGLADDVLITSVDENVISLDNSNLDKVFVANRVSAALAYTDAVSGVSPEFTAYGDPVKFVFRRAASRLRIGFYETIPGYAVTDLHFYFDDNADAPSGTSTKSQVGLQGQFPVSGQYSVTYDTNNVAHLTLGTNSTVATSRSFGELKYGKSEPIADDQHHILHDGTADSEGQDSFLGIASSSATYAVCDEVIDGTTIEASSWHPIFPYEGNNSTMQMRVDYTLVSLDGNRDKIHIKGAQVEVPANYCAWKPNYAYTYLFKISTATAGLYPISFDSVVVEESQIVVPALGL